MRLLTTDLIWPEKCQFAERKGNPPFIKEPYYYYCPLAAENCQINENHTECLYFKMIELYKTYSLEQGQDKKER